MAPRKVVVHEFMSLDGVAENVEGLFTEWDDAEVDAAGAAAIATQDAVILGRRTYDGWATFWPGSTIEPFASFINKVPKFVATSSPLDTDWDNTTAIEGGLADFVRELKARPGADIGVHGSISVAQSLLAAGLVDELSLVVAQAIAGDVGRRLLDGVPPTRLTPVRSSISPTGFLILRCHVEPTKGTVR